MRRPQRERGQALVEFALTALLFFTLILFILDGSIILWNQVTLSAAVAYGARYASTHSSAAVPGNCGSIEQCVLNNAFGLNPANLQITPSWGVGGNAVGNDVTVVLTYTVTPLTGAFWSGLPLKLHARQTAEIVN